LTVMGIQKDKLLEREISRVMRVVTSSSERSQKIKAFTQARQLIAQRSPEQVKRMESQL